jgi:hypothetical protein
MPSSNKKWSITLGVEAVIHKIRECISHFHEHKA